MTAEEESIRELTRIPGVGRSIAADLLSIGIRGIADLRGEGPEELYERLNARSGSGQDRCLLYVFRCAVYYAETPEPDREGDRLKWWNWKDGTRPPRKPGGKYTRIRRRSGS
ncbi:MAG: helix-hairpin-helix domain-containing protein [Spirochaetes bacterium]|nr:helix-hairpin-helix domain-containing protein [Spirochaetota bacterium]